MSATKRPAEQQRCQVHYYYMGDGHCTCLDDDMSEDCMRCHQTMLIRDGEEPTEFCDHCAHEMLSELSALREERDRLRECLVKITIGLAAKTLSTAEMVDLAERELGQSAEALLAEKTK